MIAAGFSCPVCGCDLAEWLGIAVRDGSVVHRLVCLACRQEWEDL